MKDEEKIKALVEYIDYLFSEIRRDWNDHHLECRCHEGWEAVSKLKTLSGIPQDGEYRHYWDGETEESYYARIKERDGE